MSWIYGVIFFALLIAALIAAIRTTAPAPPEPAADAPPEPTPEDAPPPSDERDHEVVDPALLDIGGVADPRL
jgi:hypothetical protein